MHQKAQSFFLLGIGDMLVYSGCELEHWREPFQGNVCGQVFLHYNHVNGPFANKNKFDGRPMLGLPKNMKNKLRYYLLHNPLMCKFEGWIVSLRSLDLD